MEIFDFDKINNFDDKIDIEELEIDSDLDEEDNDYYSEKNTIIDPFLIDDNIENTTKLCKIYGEFLHMPTNENNRQTNINNNLISS